MNLYKRKENNIKDNHEFSKKTIQKIKNHPKPNVYERHSKSNQLQKSKTLTAK